MISKETRGEMLSESARKTESDLLTFVLICRGRLVWDIIFVLSLKAQDLMEMFNVRDHEKRERATITSWKIIVVSNSATAQPVST